MGGWVDEGEALGEGGVKERPRGRGRPGGRERPRGRGVAAGGATGVGGGGVGVGPPGCVWCAHPDTPTPLQCQISDRSLTLEP